MGRGPDGTERRTSGGGVPHGEGRAALLSAAVHVVATQGLRRLTYRSVAREAQVAHTLVAHHFGSRDALLREAFTFAVERTLPTVTSPGSGDVEEFLSTLASVTAQNPDDQALFFTLALESRHTPALRPLVDDLYATFRTAIADELAAMGFAPDDQLTHLVLSSADGLLFQQLCFGHSERTEAGVALLRELITATRGR